MGAWKWLLVINCLFPVFAIRDGYSFSGRDVSGISRDEEGVHFWWDGGIYVPTCESYFVHVPKSVEGGYPCWKITPA